MLDRTVFYATSGGQPGDRGVLTTAAGDDIAIGTASLHRCRQDRDRACPRPTGARAALKPGEQVHAAIDWELRYPRMRMHTALHLLSAVLPFPVTGGSVGDSEGRLDFDIPDAGLDKDEITAKLAAMIAADAEVRTRWISDDELAANPGLVKTMSVQAADGHRPRAPGRDRRATICSPAAARMCAAPARSAPCA